MLAPPPTRLPTEERQAEIVAAALQLAREASPPLITTADIAAVVGVSQGAVFKHFPSKDAIWVAVMAWVRVRFLAALEAAAGSAETPLDALAAVFRAHLRFVATYPGVPRVIFHELQEPQDTAVKREVRALLQAYHQLLLQLLDSAARRSGGRSGRGCRGDLVRRPDPGPGDAGHDGRRGHFREGAGRSGLRYLPARHPPGMSETP